jgi:Xaa-Pro aminopeptidase
MMTNISIQAFKQTRLRLLQQLSPGIAIIPTAAEVVRNRDSHYPYRFDSYFYYLTGFTEPESVLVLIAGKQPKSILFCREKNLEKEIWDGFRYGPEAALTSFEMDETYSIHELDRLLPELMANQQNLYYSWGAYPQWDEKLTGMINHLRSQSRLGMHAPAQTQDIYQILDEMRLIKSADEQAVMRRSASIAAMAHQRAMNFTRPGLFEYEVEAEFLHEFRRHGAQSPAYGSIVAGGANACTLHYHANNCELKSGDLLLIDAGCELDGYASDITRTFPVNGKFSPAQKAVYELVLASQYAAIDSVRVGQHWNAPHEAALQILVQGFKDFGWCHGSVESIIESGSYRQFYMHRTGHWLGLDVHDAGEYKTAAGDWRNLEAGMVTTVEPGCYIRPADNVAEEFWNIGVRIEDDVLVQQNGPEVLSAAAPKSVQQIEDLMRND